MSISEVKGAQLDSNHPKYQHLKDPGIYDDDECCGSTRHIVRLPDGSLFDLGEAEKTMRQVHVLKEGQDTGKHIPVDQIVIAPAPYSRL